VGEGYNAATNRIEAFLLDTGFPLRGDVDRNGCVDDADLLAVLFAFGSAATATKTSTGTAQLTTPTCWRCCSTSAVGVDPPSSRPC
jgi:hypothetical protein